MTIYQAVLFAIYKRRHKLSKATARKCKPEFMRVCNPSSLAAFLMMRKDILGNRYRYIAIQGFGYIEASAHD